ncbi:LrgB family protein [Paenibacillus sp. An7]|uniref:LrgB family protein n=1 Tax=Paenibacillus sp. An7 TaxID=2689577 RepID=UPI00135B7701|nr:LrgB family protein [Paenibacillus sp. An7]
MTALLCLVFTLAIYLLAKKMYKKMPKVYLSPLIIVPVVVIVALLTTNTSYSSYNKGGSILTLLLQPATVAFAIPLYKYLKELKQYWREIVTGVSLGSVVAISSSVLVAKGLHLDPGLESSLLPHSITTPIAMNVATMIGGVPQITAVFVVMTGLMGLLIGPYTLKLLKIDGEIPRGILYGTSAHGTGTSKAFEFSPLTGTISSISMVLSAIITLAISPVISMLLFS